MNINNIIKEEDNGLIKFKKYLFKQDISKIKKIGGSYKHGIVELNTRLLLNFIKNKNNYEFYFNE